MNNLRHPSELNPYQLYQQAKRVAKRTSRAKNPDWYEQAFAIQRQWHLWFDGGEVVSALFDQGANRWAEGPGLSFLGREDEGDAGSIGEGLAQKVGMKPADREELQGALAEALRSRELGGKVKSLGVVFHVADEFAVLDPAREFSSMADFDKVQEILQEDPKEVLGDSTVDPLLNTWRLLPCWGVKEGRLSMAVQLERRREGFFAAVREYGEDNNIAIVVVGVSSPLETLRLAPLYLDWEQGRGDVIVMIYRNFSAMAVLDGAGELLLLRSLAHRAGVEYPIGLGDILLNTRTSVGLKNPVVSILPMGVGGAQEQVTQELTAFFARREPMDIGFSELNQMDALQTVPHHRIEMLLGDGVAMGALLEGKPLGENHTFSGLAGGWATQDFYPVERAEMEKYPTWQELRMRKWFGVAKVALLVALTGMAVWGGGKVLKAISSEAWQTPGLDSDVASTAMAKLVKEGKEADYWEAIMENRSPGWLVMQLMMDLFPEGSGVVMADCTYSITTERATSGSGGGKKAEGLGFSRKWEITGFAQENGLAYLTKLGSTGFMRSQFNATAKQYDARSFDMEVAKRTMRVTLQRDQKSYPASGVLGKGGEGYSVAFTLTIQQSFAADDELAVPIESGVVAKKN